MSDVVSVPISVQLALNIGKQSRAGALGLLIYERLIVIQEEVDLVWTKKKGWVTYLYLFNGWLALLWLSFDIIPLFPGGLAPSNVCTIYLLCDDIVTLLMTISVQVVLQLRVWAIYGRSKKILYFLIALSVAEAAVMIVLIVITITHIERLPVISTSTGCYYEGLLPLSAGFWIPAMIVEPILCLLVLKKALSAARGRTRLSVLLARDSLLYFVVIFAELVASTVVWAHQPFYINTVMPWSAAIPSLMGTRLLLNTRRHFTSPVANISGSGDVELSAYSAWEPRRPKSVSVGGVSTLLDVPV
ncbi:hypothetical protein BS17DRAFT_779698 [Gyrodon lividus]|nr:hypothetical protein BS17DRAFT_779698 [Gyrodon lividus]